MKRKEAENDLSLFLAVGITGQQMLKFYKI